jgi:hypothetical protein
MAYRQNPPTPGSAGGWGLPKVSNHSEPVKFGAEPTSPDPLYFGHAGCRHGGRMRPTWTAIGPNFDPNPGPNLDPNFGPNLGTNPGADIGPNPGRDLVRCSR